MLSLAHKDRSLFGVSTRQPLKMPLVPEEDWEKEPYRTVRTLQFFRDFRHEIPTFVPTNRNIALVRLPFFFSCLHVSPRFTVLRKADARQEEAEPGRLGSNHDRFAIAFV